MIVFFFLTPVVG